MNALLDERRRYVESVMGRFYFLAHILQINSEIGF
jgi:hypothetical protein